MACPIRLAYKTFGSHSRTKSPILILHGLLGSSKNWQSMAKRISSGLETIVYALDARNHGNSDHVNQMDYYVMCKDVVRFCEDHQLEKTTVIGHSMGGRTAMQLALDSAECVGKLLVLDVAPSARHYARGEMEGIVQAIRSVDLSKIQNRKEAVSVLHDRIQSSSLRNFILTSLTHNGTNIRWKFNLEVIANNLSPLMNVSLKNGTFYGPTMFIGGGNSKYITSLDTEEILQMFPMATVSHIAGAGHWVHMDKPNEFIADLKEFYRK